MSSVYQRVGAAIGLAVLLAACAGLPTGLKATTDYNHSYDFSRIHKVAIQPIPRDTLSTMMTSDEQINRINTALTAELRRRGFEVVASNAEADIFLSWKFLPPEKDEVATFDPATQQITGGTLIVSMIDPLSLQSVWRATIHSNMRSQPDTEEAARYRQQAAQAVLAQFPPDPAGG
ncbi:MAG: DUF4136 domain-containing protein [Halioglobus sp.]|nr:DUF4136 domain-containing protein [Halioglobus sp.]